MEGSAKDKAYCICKSAYNKNQPMIGCDGPCQDWYHFACVGIPQNFRSIADWYCESCFYKLTKGSAKVGRPQNKSCITRHYQKCSSRSACVTQSLRRLTSWSGRRSSCSRSRSESSSRSRGKSSSRRRCRSESCIRRTRNRSSRGSQVVYVEGVVVVAVVVVRVVVGVPEVEAPGVVG